MLVQQLVLLFRTDKMLIAHFDLHIVVVGDFNDFLLQLLNLICHVTVSALKLLLERADLFIF